MYQVLARKYRPKNFHQLLGQEHVAKALSNAINHQRLHHAYLFTGTRGVGKTTIARILAKCLNCETGITAEPCGVCTTCQSIDAGRFIDLIEIDAASRTKVEDTRELLDNVPYAPTQGRYKVYLIDEVHMLSTHSFNALLKTLEEPPEHVKFLLATTDPQKLPITIISRCLQFVLRPLPQPQLAAYLGQILGQEQISVTQDALWQLANSANGSVRDALSLTDQAIAFGDGSINDDTVRQMLGLIDQADVLTILTLIYQQRTSELAQVIRQLREQVVDAKAIFDRMAEVLHQVALMQLVPGLDLQLNQQQTQALMQLATALPGEMVQLYYDIVVKSRENIALANTPLQALEMCLLRLLAFKPLGTLQIVTPPMPVAEPASSGNVAPTTAQSNRHVMVPDVTQIAQAPTNIPLDTGAVLSDDKPVSQAATTTVGVADTKVMGDAQHTEQQSPSLSQTVGEDDGGSRAADPSDHPLEPTKLPNHNHPVTAGIDGIPDSRDANIMAAVGVVTANLEVPAVLPQPVHDSATHQPPSDVCATMAMQTDAHHAPTQGSTQDPVLSAPLEDSDNPLDLLHPAPQVLQGEWTAQKWDYWLNQARHYQWLAADELALANESLVRGQIGGVSEFVTSIRHDSIAPTFAKLREKLQQQMPGTQLSLQQLPGNDQQLYSNSPKFLQQNREQLAVVAATAQLKSQPVLQALLAQNAELGEVKLHR